MEKLVVELPRESGLPQDREWCRVVVGGEEKVVRFHDYASIFGIPGLYEELFYAHLECASPRVLADLLAQTLTEQRIPPGSLRALDVGAGNGMVGEELLARGIGSVLGLDLLEAAAAACERDRPGLYADYVVADLTRLAPDDVARIRRARPNLLVSVAALGFGDLPSRAFAAAWNLIETPGWVVFNIKDSFLDRRFDYGFARLVRRMKEEELLEIEAEITYRHRLALDGTPLTYVGFVGRKRGEIPEAWFDWLVDEPPA